MHQCDEAARAIPVQCRNLADIGAADKGALAGAGQDHEPQLRVRGKPVGRLDDLAHQRAIEAVQLGRIVDRQLRDVAAFRPFLKLRRNAHCMPLPLPRAIPAAAPKTKQERPLPLELLLPPVHSDAGLAEAIMDVVEDLDGLREIYGPPSDRSVKKQLSRFDNHCRAFIARSPFLVIASSDPSGRCDASPKGDAPGFVQVVDDETLLIPDRLGNNRVDTLGNLLERPGVGLIFFVPGLNETLRVNGAAQRHPGGGRGNLLPLR